MRNHKRIFLALPLLGLMSPAFSAVVVTETTQYSDVENIIKEKGTKYAPEKVLVVLDIDNTLLTSGTRVGGDIWYQWQAGKLALKPEASQQVPCLYDNAITLLYELGPMQLTEANVPALVKAWQEKHTVFALTSRGADTRSSTLRELKRNGLDLSVSALRPVGQTEVPLEQGKLKRSWLYANGVFFSSGQNKGVILDFLLKKTHRSFDSIVFVDDGAANIEAMKKMLESTEYAAVDTSLIHYTRIESALAARQGSVLTQDEAEKMDQDWKTLSSTLNAIFPDRGALCSVK